MGAVGDGSCGRGVGRLATCHVVDGPPAESGFAVGGKRRTARRRIQGFYNIESPEPTEADWQLRFQVQLLSPSALEKLQKLNFREVFVKSR